MAAPEELPLPGGDEQLRFLRAEQEGYYVDYARSSAALGRITMLAVAAPTAAGKSTLVRKVTERHPDIHQYISSTTRPLEARDRGEYVQRTREQFYRAVHERGIVNYFVHPNGNVYGTFLDGFQAPYTIGAISTDSIEQLQGAGFRDVQTIYTLTDGETYAGRLGLDRINNPDILPRLKEGLVSLNFARSNAEEQWLTFLELNNKPDALELAADNVARIARHNTVESLDINQAHTYIDEMDAVIRTAIRRINVQ